MRVHLDAHVHVGVRSAEKAVAMSLAGALLAFLVYNRHPARVFMGDTGALAIGYAKDRRALQGK